MRASLLQMGLKLNERDFFENPFTDEELRQLLGPRSASYFFSWNSPSFKKLGLEKESLHPDRLISLMIEEPRFIRRPLIQTAEDLIIGTDKSAMERMFG